MTSDAMTAPSRMIGLLPGLTPREARAAQERGTVLLDLRRAADFVAEHPAGALSTQFHRALLTFRVAQAIPPGTPALLLGQNDVVVEAAAYLLATARRNPLQGFLDGGLAAWKAAGLPTATCGVVTAETLQARLAAGRDRPVVVDVREPFEWKNGTIAEAIRLRLGQVWERHRELPRDREIALVCMGGIRSCTAASILQRAGFARVLNVAGGMDAWGRANLPTVREAVEPMQDRGPVMKPDEILRYVGQRVVLTLSPQATGGPTVTGRIAGTISAADGLVVTVEPDGAIPAPRVTYHYHYILSIAPAPPA